MMYKAAIIGCGKIGCGFGEKNYAVLKNTHAGAYSACPNTELVGVCDVSSEHLVEAKKIWSVVQAYSDIDVLFQEIHPDIISVCTPDITHYAIIKQILSKYGVSAILSEKPFTLSSTEAKELLSLANQKDVILSVNYSRRFDEQHRKIKSIIQNGKIGSVQTINAYYTKGTFHNGSHLLDLARFLIGDIEAVIGFNTLHEHSSDPTYDILLKFCNGSKGFFHACNKIHYTIFEIDIVGTDGRIHIMDSGHICRFYIVQDSDRYVGHKMIALRDEYNNEMENTLLNAVTNIVEHMETNTKLLCSGIDGLQVIEICESIQKSVENNSTLEYVNIND